MTDERFNELMSNEDLKLTPEEIKEGYFFCNDCDGLLTNEKDCCLNNLNKDDSEINIEF